MYRLNFNVEDGGKTAVLERNALLYFMIYLRMTNSCSVVMIHQYIQKVSTVHRNKNSRDILSCTSGIDIHNFIIKGKKKTILITI